MLTPRPPATSEGTLSVKRWGTLAADGDRVANQVPLLPERKQTQCGRPDRVREGERESEVAVIPLYGVSPGLH